MKHDCFLYNNQLISFSTFYQHIHQTRHNIAKYTGNNVMLFHTDSYQFTVLLFALILEGKHVILPPNKQSGTLNKLSKYCDITSGDIKLDSIPHIKRDESLPTKNEESLSIIQLFSLFNGNLTFFTSGSTGQPKAIKKTCGQLLRELNTLSSTFREQFTNTHAVVSTVPHQHIYGLLFKILLPLRLAKIIVNKTYEYPEHIQIDLQNYIFSSPQKKKQLSLISSPAHLSRLVIDNVLKNKSSYYCATFSSGGLLSLETSQLFQQQMGNAPIEVFGSTETGGIAWRNNQKTLNTPWRVFSSINYHVDDLTSRLAIYSPYVDEQPYWSDDTVQAIDEKHFILQGRIDRTVKIEEKRVNLDHIEQCLIEHPWVTHAKVLLIKNLSNTFQRNVLSCALTIHPEAYAFIKENGKRALNNKFKSHLLKDFERICLPKKWRYIDKFPYNAQGKLVLRDMERLFD